MTLTPEMRASLHRRAEELRTEVSSLTAERDAALAAQSDSVADAKLIAEVEGLERLVEAARNDRDRAVSNTDDSMKLMEEALARQEQAAAQQNAGSAEPVTVTEAQDADNVELKDSPPDPDPKAETPVVQDEPVDKAEESASTEESAKTATNKIKGGNR